MSRKHYDVLQLQPNATADEIQHAYRALAMRYHPDRNSSPDAATKMAAINEAYETLRDGNRPKPRPASHESPNQGNGVNLELAVSVLSAARAVILRQGWATVHDDDSIVLFTYGKSSTKIALVDRLTSELLVRIMRRVGGLTAILAGRVEGRFAAGVAITIFDLMRAEKHGAAVPEGPCKTLLAAFL